MPLSIGQVLNDRYRIDTLLGQGGKGEECVKYFRTLAVD